MSCCGLWPAWGHISTDNPQFASIVLRIPQSIEIRSAIRQVAGDLEQGIDEIVEAEFRLLRSDPGPLKPFLALPEAVEPTLSITRLSLLEEIHALAELKLPDSCPPLTAELARQAVLAGAPATIVQQGFRAGHSALSDAAIASIVGMGLAESERKDLIAAVAEFLFAYVNRSVRFAADAFEAERAKLRSVQVLERQGIVRELLAGGTVAEGLDYDMTLHHIGAIAWGADAEPALRALATAHDRRLLVVPAVGDTVWGWLGSRSSELRPPPDGFELPDDAQVAFGAIAGGLDGFRASHRQARLAQLVALRRAKQLTNYRDVGLEALAFGDETAAETFVAAETAPLAAAGDGPRLPLRATLRAWFRSGQNAAAAAAALGVSERTVAYRLGKLEAVLGEPVARRRAELETALRLEELMEGGPAVRARL